jgi:hypothetical protein
MKRYRWLGLGVVALATTLPVLAQEKRDNVSEGFRAFIVNEPRFAASEIRNRAGKMQDLVCDHGLNPVIAVFSRTIPADATHPLNAIIAKQDELANDYASRRLGTYAVFLSLKDEFRKDETRDARLAEIQRFIKEASPKRTTIGLAEATVTPDGTNQAAVPSQVTAMGIEADDDLVIVLYNRFGVVKRWKFKDDAPPTPEKLGELTAEVEKLLGKIKKKAPAAPAEGKEPAKEPVKE